MPAFATKERALSCRIRRPAFFTRLFVEIPDVSQWARFQKLPHGKTGMMLTSMGFRVLFHGSSASRVHVQMAARPAHHTSLFDNQGDPLLLDALARLSLG